MCVCVFSCLFPRKINEDDRRRDQDSPHHTGSDSHVQVRVRRIVLPPQLPFSGKEGVALALPNGRRCQLVPLPPRGLPTGREGAPVSVPAFRLGVRLGVLLEADLFVSVE